MSLFERRPTLMVSLPRNDAVLGQAAVDGGADGLKTHINVDHRASGTHFGSVSQERADLEKILGLGVPTGLVVGGEGTVQYDEMTEATAMGFAFFDAYLRHAPAWYVDACGTVPAVAALSGDEPLERAAVLERLGFAAVEASLAAPSEYGSALPASRIADYARLARLTSLPVIVPTQHALAPEDVQALVAAGVSAVLIGAVCTGHDPDRISEVTRAFRDAIDNTNPRPAKPTLLEEEDHG
jgi:hypothetical protein